MEEATKKKQIDPKLVGRREFLKYALAGLASGTGLATFSHATFPNEEQLVQKVMKESPEKSTEEAQQIVGNIKKNRKLVASAMVVGMTAFGSILGKTMGDIASAVAECKNMAAEAEAAKYPLLDMTSDE